MKISVVIITVLLAVPGCDSKSLRSFDNGELLSAADPVMSVKIAPDFVYLGPDIFLLGDTHEAERQHFVTLEGSEVTALLVFQFERVLDGVPGQYKFSTPPAEQAAGSNYRYALNPVRLGSHEYVHNTWAFNNRENARENPGRESDRTLQLLDSHGYSVDDGLIMARYARAVGADSRKELIVFYMEPLRKNGHSIDEFPDGEPPTELFDKLSNAVVARAGDAFEILPAE